MTLHADNALPDDPASLVAVIAALRNELTEAQAARRTAELGLQIKTLEAEKLRAQIARLRHQQYGHSSERLAHEVAQLELRLDEVLANIAAAGSAEDAEDEAAAAATPDEKAPRRGRKPLPENLPRRDVEHLPAAGCACQACGGVLRKVGEDATEILEYRPGRFEVVRHVRPAFSCRTCEAMTQAPMPSLPIARGRPGPGLQTAQGTHLAVAAIAGAPRGSGQHAAGRREVIGDRAGTVVVALDAPHHGQPGEIGDHIGGTLQGIPPEPHHP